MSAEKAVNSVESRVCVRGAGKVIESIWKLPQSCILFLSPQTHRFFLFPKGAPDLFTSFVLK